MAEKSHKQKVKERRQKILEHWNKYTDEQLAQECGCSVSTIQRTKKFLTKLIGNKFLEEMSYGKLIVEFKEAFDDTKSNIAVLKARRQQTTEDKEVIAYSAEIRAQNEFKIKLLAEETIMEALNKYLEDRNVQRS